MHDYTVRLLNDDHLAEFDREAAQIGLAREGRRRPTTAGRLMVITLALWTRQHIHLAIARARGS
jgi:hypothetical protein